MKDMNILVLAPFYNVYIKEFTETLANYVSSITVVVHHNPLTEISKYLPKRGYVRYLHRYTKDNLVDKEGTPDNVNIEIVSLPYFIPDGKNPFLGDWIFKKVSRIIQKRSVKFDIIHAHSTWIDGYVGAKIKKMYNKPLTITLHHHIDIELRHIPIIKRKVEWALKTANLLISVNKQGIKKLPNNFQKKSMYLPNGIDTSKIYPINKKKARKILGLPLDKKILLSIGYLINGKGFEYLVHAMQYVTETRKDVISIIAGEGPIKDRLNKYILQLKLYDNIKLIGYISGETKNLWLNSADILIFPSIKETFGLPVLEALAVGTPVVATINGGSEEIITSDDYGLLARPADPEDLAEKILIALERDWNREKIRKYVEQFTWDNIAKQTLEIYKKVLYEEGTWTKVLEKN